MKLILLGILSLLAISADGGKKSIPHRSQPIQNGEALWFQKNVGELDDKLLQDWDYVIRVVELPSFKTPLYTDYFVRHDLTRYHIRRLDGESVDVDLVLALKSEEESDLNNAPATLPEWAQKLPEKGGRSGLDGSEFIVKVLGRGIRKTIYRWSPDIQDKDPLEAGLAGFIDSNYRYTGIRPRSPVLRKHVP